MSFDLRIIEFSVEQINAMKPAVFHKISDGLTRSGFKFGQKITVSDLIKKTQPYMHDIEGISPPAWWKEIPEPPQKFGQRLHTLLSDSFNELRKQDASFFHGLIGHSSEDVANKLFPFLYDRVVLPSITQSKNNDTVQLNLLVGMALKEWTLHLGGIFNQYPSNKPFNAKRFFIATELNAKATIKFPVGGVQKTLQINGRLDALIYDYIHDRIFIYEYKSGQQKNYIAQIIQCIMYRELILDSCGKQLNPAAVLAIFCPVDLNMTIDDQEQKPLQEDPPKPKPVKQQTRVDSDNEAKALIQSVVDALCTFKLNVSARNYVIGPRFIQLQVEPQGQTTVNQIRSRREDLVVKMNLKSPPSISSKQGFVAIEVERSTPDIVELADARFENNLKDIQKGCYFPLGLDVLGTAQWIDLSDSNSCHLLIGGTTGSGKSVFIQSVISFLQKTYAPADVRLLVIDPKQVTYNAFGNSSHLLKPIICTKEESTEGLESFVIEMDSRYSKFKDGQVTDIVSWNEKFPDKKMPRWIMIFDEYADYMADKSFKSIIESSIERLGYMARAAGIHLIIALQRPDAKTVSSRIKSNLPGRIAFHVASQMESRIILDEKGAEDLFGKGDMLSKIASKITRVQAPYIQC